MATTVTPDTIMPWHRRLIAAKWTFEVKHRVGRPGLMRTIKAVGSENSADVWTPYALHTYYVLFVIDLSTRRAHIAGITRRPGAAFMAQVARNLTGAVDGFLLPHRNLICDRDTKFIARLAEILRESGVEIIRTPFQAPNCNAYAERFVMSIKVECLSRMMLFGEAGLRHAVTSQVEHDYRERPHQGIAMRSSKGQARSAPGLSSAPSAWAGPSRATVARREGRWLARCRWR